MTNLKGCLKCRIRAVIMGVVFASAFWAWGAPTPLPSEITVKLKFEQNVFVLGERIRGIVDVANTGVDSIDVGSVGSEDLFSLELYRASDHQAYSRVSDRPVVAPFTLHSSEGQRLEVFFSDHFAFAVATRYLARVVLVHRGMRYESALKGFDVVPGMHVAGAMQMFSNRDNLRRSFELVHWGRDRMEHLFLKAHDLGSERRWVTTDLGPYMGVTAPKISITPSGEVTVLHRSSQDHFTRTVFWSLPDDLEFQSHALMTDPDVAGAERVKNVYREAGEAAKKSDVKKKKSWWKFW